MALPGLRRADAGQQAVAQSSRRQVELVAGERAVAIVLQYVVRRLADLRRNRARGAVIAGAVDPSQPVGVGASGELKHGCKPALLGADIGGRCPGRAFAQLINDDRQSAGCPRVAPLEQHVVIDHLLGNGRLAWRCHDGVVGGGGPIVPLGIHRRNKEAPGATPVHLDRLGGALHRRQRCGGGVGAGRCAVPHVVVIGRQTARHGRPGQHEHTTADQAGRGWSRRWADRERRAGA